MEKISPSRGIFPNRTNFPISRTPRKFQKVRDVQNVLEVLLSLIRIPLGSIPDFPKISEKNFLEDFATRGRGSPSEGSEGLGGIPGFRMFWKFRTSGTRGIQCKQKTIPGFPEWFAISVEELSSCRSSHRMARIVSSILQSCQPNPYHRKTPTRHCLCLKEKD